MFPNLTKGKKEIIKQEDGTVICRKHFAYYADTPMVEEEIDAKIAELQGQKQEVIDAKAK